MINGQIAQKLQILLFFASCIAIILNVPYIKWVCQNWSVSHLIRLLKMFGTFNQHLPMILSNNYWCQSKPTCFLFRVNLTTLG